MIREYKTIQEIASPLMIVKNVEGVTYDAITATDVASVFSASVCFSSASSR